MTYLQRNTNMTLLKQSSGFLGKKYFIVRNFFILLPIGLLSGPVDDVPLGYFLIQENRKSFEAPPTIWRKRRPANCYAPYILKFELKFMFRQTSVICYFNWKLGKYKFIFSPCFDFKRFIHTQIILAKSELAYTTQKEPH